MKKNYKKITRLTNTVDASTSKSRSFGFVPVPKKFGNTTNFEIPEWMFKLELDELYHA